MGAGGTAEAAAGTGGEARALDALRLTWGPEYLFGCDDERGWWAVKSGRLGSLLTAGGPEELGRKVAAQEGTGT